MNLNKIIQGLIIAPDQTIIFRSIGLFRSTRPKPAYGQKGLGWDPQARIQFRQVQLGVDTFQAGKMLGSKSLLLFRLRRWASAASLTFSVESSSFAG